MFKNSLGLCFAAIFIFSCSGTNGINGEQGVDGKNGKDGIDCEIKTTTEDLGHDYEIICSWTSADYLDNGAIGPQGEQGEQGKGCNVATDPDNSAYLVMTCGSGETIVAQRWAKALCGSTAYDPETHFCFNQNKIWNKNNVFKDTRDGKIYRTAVIGEQTWMAENLNYGKCYGNCDIMYGTYYNWNTAMSICPKDWHLPTNIEWQRLIATIGGSAVNNYDFSALLGGFYYNDNFYNVGSYGLWWTADDIQVETLNVAVSWIMSNSDVTVQVFSKDLSLTVRCVHD